MDINTLKFLKELFEEELEKSADENPNDFSQWLQEKRYDLQTMNAHIQGMYRVNSQGNPVSSSSSYIGSPSFTNPQGTSSSSSYTSSPSLTNTPGLVFDSPQGLVSDSPQGSVEIFTPPPPKYLEVPGDGDSMFHSIIARYNGGDGDFNVHKWG